MAERKNVNDATREDIAALPFMSKERAEMIVHYREVNGPFSSVKDIEKVTGINERLAGRVAEYFDVSDNTASDEKSSKGETREERINREAEEEEAAARDSKSGRRHTSTAKA